MFWGTKRTRHWLTASGVIGLSCTDHRHALAGEWSWWSSSNDRLPRGDYVLAPEVTQLKLVVLPQGLALKDIEPFVMSLFPTNEAWQVTWQPVGQTSLLAMAAPAALMARLPRWSTITPWLVARFNRHCGQLNGTQWHWLTVYPGGASIFSGRGTVLQRIDKLTTAEWQAALPSPATDVQCALDDPFDLLENAVLPGWERLT